MDANISTTLVLLVLLNVKHMFSDYFLQNDWMLSGRATYLHLGRLAHAVIHAFGTAVVVALIGGGVLVAIFLAVADLLIHFHVDWLKAKYSESRKLTPADTLFWRVAGADQFAHQLTYIMLIWFWLQLV